MKVFIVDDASFLCERLGAALSDIVGVELVGMAGTVATALAALASVQPDLVILDIGLPDGTGYDILKHLRETAPQVGVIMISGEVYPQYRERAIKAGAMAFFDKSQEFEAICIAVARMASAQTDSKHAAG